MIGGRLLTGLVVAVALPTLALATEEPKPRLKGPDPMAEVTPPPLPDPNKDPELFLHPKAAPKGLRLRAFTAFDKTAKGATLASGEPINLLPDPARAAPAKSPDSGTTAVEAAPKKPAVKRLVDVPLPRPRPPLPVPAALPEDPPAAPPATVPAAPEPPAPAPEPKATEAPSAPPVKVSAELASARDLAPDFVAMIGDPVDEPPAISGEIVATAEMPSTEPEGQPFELVRLLQTYQDQIARGSTEALVAQRKLRVRIDQTFASASPAVWQDHRNADAAVVYVLSGGAPQILHRFAELDPPAAVDDRLVRGALAYVEGREKEASELLLSDVDPLSLPASMGAQVAIAQAALSIRHDPKMALTYLDTARLLAPGTLVEEAALRREIYVADQVKDYRKFEMLARQYLQRFRHSIYAGNFRNRFAAALTHMEFINDPQQFGRLDDMLNEVERDARRELYLTVAGAAIVDAKTVAAGLAAERALALAEDGSADAARAHLYQAAAKIIVADTFDAAATDLEAVNPQLLSAGDRSLFEAVSTTAELIRTATVVPADIPPEEATPAATPAEGEAPAAPPAAADGIAAGVAPAGDAVAADASAAAADGAKPAEPAKPPAVIARAETALGEVDKLLDQAP